MYKFIASDFMWKSYLKKQHKQMWTVKYQILIVAILVNELT